MNQVSRSDPNLPPRKRPAICVFCGSSHGSDPAYTATARRFGELMAKQGFDLVFGAGGVGLMGEVAGAAAKAGARVTGIIPDFLRHLEPPLATSSEIIVTQSMNERKARMWASSDAFAVLPGGIGTLDELAEALTGAQLKVHSKPIVLVNTKNYFVPLIALLEHFVAQQFMRASVLDLIQVVPTVEAALDAITAHVTALQADAPSRKSL